MKQVITNIFLIILTFVITFSCSKLQDEITPPIAVGVHAGGVTDISSQNFHGNLLIDQNFLDCQQCHADFSGGTTDVSCSSANCHPSIIVHKEGILTPDSPNFHGKFIKNNNWKLSECSQCHELDYAGGIASPSCNECHTNPGGPEACNTCHGDFGDVNLIAPPTDLDGNSETSAPGVGAHSQHLFDTELIDLIECNDCHIIPSQFESDGHIDNPPNAEVIFSSFATSSVSDPSYNFENFTCANTYCHGNFEFLKDSSSFPFVYTEDKIIGNNFSPVWNQVDGTQAECGTCHGLPPTGHQEAQLTTCVTCHQGIVDAEGNIIDNTKHMNGEANVFGN